MRSKLIIVLLSVCFLTNCGLLTKEAVMDAHEDVFIRNYKEALNALEDVEPGLSDLTRNQQAEVYLIKAKALYGLDRFEEANKTLTILISNYSDCDFSAQAAALLKIWDTTK
ncbi:hypothetical protein KKA14_13190 [bacterium]|nr:hypothetical protein [bacterium]